MINNKNKRGFTLTELVIVIVIIALLAAVLVPMYTGLVSKAKDSDDTSLVKMLNDAMMDSEYHDEYKHDTYQDVIDTLYDYGFVADNLQAKSSKNTLVWNQVTNRFYILTDDGSIDTRDSNPDPSTVYYPEDQTEKTLIDDTNAYTFWVIYNKDVTGVVSISEANNIKTIYSNYSVYLAKNIEGSIVTTKGIDVGKNSNITSINYSNSTNSQNAIIRTYSTSTTLTVVDENELSHIKQYGDCGIINATVGMHSMEINGTVGYLEVAKGHVVVNGSVELVYTAAASSETVLVEGNVEHAHANSQTNANGLNNTTYVDAVTWDYDGSNLGKSTTVNHESGEYASSTDNPWNVENGKYEVATSAVVAQAYESTTKKAVYNVTSGVYYHTLSGATLVSGKQNVLVLLDNINDQNISIAESSDMIVDLNGKTVTSTSTVFTINGSLTINDSVGTGKINKAADAAGILFPEGSNNAKLTINGGTITFKGDWEGIYDKGHNTSIIINGGEVNNAHEGGSGYAKAIAAFSSSDYTTTVEINGGKITSVNCNTINDIKLLTINGGYVYSETAVAIFVPSFGTLNVYGGEISTGTAAYCYGISSAGSVHIYNANITSGGYAIANNYSTATLTIDNGTFTAGANYALFNGEGTITINNGTFNSGASEVVLVDKDSKTFITGGDFSCDQTDNGKSYLINKMDSSTAVISISGGTFHGFDPADNTDSSYLANDYQSTETSTGIWTVTPGSGN